MQRNRVSLAPLDMTAVIFLCAVFGCFNCIPLTAQTQTQAKALSPFEQNLIALEKSFIAAKKQDDGAFFKRQLSSDFSLVGIDGNLMQGREAIDGVGDSDLVELTPYAMKVVAAGDEAAIVTYDA